MESKYKGARVFLLGALAGLLAAGLFGYLTYPERPGFEGAGGYHFLAMMVVVPVATLTSGILSYLVYSLRKKP